MTQDQFNEFLEMFGDKLPNPDMYPQIFKFYIKMFKHVKGYK